MEHPRIAQLRSHVYKLPLDEHSRAVLLKSIEYFRDTIVVAQPPCVRRKAGDHLAARHEAATSGMMERAQHEQYGGAGRC